MSKDDQLDDRTAVEGAGASGASNSSGGDEQDRAAKLANLRETVLTRLSDQEQENNSCLSRCLSAPQACFNFLWASVSSSSESTSPDSDREGLVSGENKDQETTSSDVFDF